MSYTNRNSHQDGDVLFLLTKAGGDICAENGITTMTAVYDTMIDITLTGGNEDDDGTPSTESLQWAGNEDEPEINKLRGRFHKWTQGRSINTGNLTELQKDATDDLTEAFVDIAKEITVKARLITSRRVELTIDIIDSIGSDFRYVKEFGK
jgi:hypothetical protein